MPQHESIEEPVVNKDSVYVWFIVIAVIATSIAIGLGDAEIKEFYS